LREGNGNQGSETIKNSETNAKKASRLKKKYKKS
jgi:hypothetical protein